MSANRSIPTILIIGDFADERSSHLSVLQNMKKNHAYDKGRICQGLTDCGIIISTVLYAYNKDGCITSRYSHSAVAIWDVDTNKNGKRLSDTYKEEEHTRVDDNVIKINNQFRNQINATLKKKKSWKVYHGTFLLIMCLVLLIHLLLFNILQSMNV